MIATVSRGNQVSGGGALALPSGERLHFSDARWCLRDHCLISGALVATAFKPKLPGHHRGFVALDHVERNWSAWRKAAASSASGIGTEVLACIPLTRILAARGHCDWLPASGRQPYVRQTLDH